MTPTIQHEPWIFISYRRASGGQHLAPRVKAFLEASCGPSSVFLDASTIPGGAEWLPEIRKHVASSLATLLLITPDWIPPRADPEDVLLQELQLSLAGGNFILPLLFDGAKMPNFDDLPESLRFLTAKQGYFLDSRSENIFAAAMSVVCKELREMFPSTVQLVRERAGWWDRNMNVNTWSADIDGQKLVELTGRMIEAKQTCLPGPHRLKLHWNEDASRATGNKWGPVDVHHHSYGATPEIRVCLWPGTYRFTLRSLPEQDTRGWLAKFFASTNDEVPRTTHQLAFASLSKESADRRNS